MVLLLAIVACTTAPLSGGRTGAATAVRPAPPPPPPPVATPEPPAPPPSTVITHALPPIASPPTITSDTIALVLPLESTAYGPAADAVRAGFLAAAKRAGIGPRIRVIGHGDDGVLPAMESASNGGVALVVGPLTRDDLKTVLATAPSHPRTLALNQPDDGSPLPDDTYALTLSFDSDAVQLADLARADGARSVAIVASKGALQRRFATAFAAEWQATGGSTPSQYAFDPNPELLGQLRRDLSAHTPDAVLLAIESDDTALAKSFLPQSRVYAVSHIADDLAPTMLRDLEGVRYIEIPWIADPERVAPAGPARTPYESLIQERLYALGLDALALSQMLAEPVPPDRVELDGATGHLSLTPGRTFARQGTVMVIREGHAVPDAAGR